MTKGADTFTCPACRTPLSLEQISRGLDDERAFARLVQLSVPLAHLVVQYVALFTPERQSLTLRKKVLLIEQLLPSLQRGVLTYKGREWTAPLAAWAQAIEQMLTARAAGRLDLPMTGHSYLFAIVAGLADKQEAHAERASETSRRTTPERSAVQVRGAAVNAAHALAGVLPARDPALAALDAADRNAAPMPAQVRERLAALRGAAPAASQLKDEPKP